MLTPLPSLPAGMRRTTRRAMFVFLASVSFVASAHGQQPVTGETLAYNIWLQPGDNIVALPAVSEDPTIEAVVSSVLPEMDLVQDQTGSYYVPSQEINDLGAWAWNEAYRVHVSSPAVLSVQGPGIVPEASPIILEEGVNWIPYLRNSALPVEEALSSIASSLEMVQGSGGLVYEPNTESSTLEWLVVGQGYKVWVSRRDTLVYPANTLPGNGASEAATISQALALPGLEVGQEIDVLGYYAPGDGGGGRFRVEANGATPDGGTVFVPSAATSAVVTETLPNSENYRQLPIPASEDVLFGSLKIDLLSPSSGASLLEVDGAHLHGVEWMSRHTTINMDYETGILRDRRRRLNGACAYFTGGDGWACDLRFTYRHTTGDLRLVRDVVGTTLVAEWFGARTYDDDPDFDNQPILNHMINVASEMNAAAPGSVTTLLFSKPAVYEYFGSIRLKDGLTIKGRGGTELVSATNDLGIAYQPVRLKGERTTLRVKSNEALTFLRMRKDPSEAHYLAPDAKQFFDARQSVIYVEPEAMSAGLEDIYLDGNWEGNEQAWTEGWASFGELETWLRNAPGWSGLVSTNHGVGDIALGQQISLRNVAIMGYGATGILGNVNVEWTAENVRLGNTQHNHSLYGANGTYTNLTFAGFAWNHVAWTVGTINNLVFEEPASGRRDESFFFQYRGKDAYDQEEVADGAPGGYYVRTDGTPLYMATTINGCHIDMRGGPEELTAPFNGIGKELEIRDCTLIGDPDISNIFHTRGNGLEKSQYLHYRFEDIEVIGGGSVFGWVMSTESVFRNITMRNDQFGGRGDHAFVLSAHRRNHPSWDNMQVNVFDGIRPMQELTFLAQVDVNPESAGADYFILDSEFNNIYNTVFRTPNGTGRIDGLGGPPELLRIYMQDVAFRIPQAEQFSNLEAFLTTAFFDGVTDTVSGRLSESAGTASFTASSGQTYVDVDPGLWWVPMEAANVSWSGDGDAAIASVAPACPNADDTFGFTGQNKTDCSLRFTFASPLSAGQSVSFDWEAAIKPWPEGVTVPDTNGWGD